MSSIHSQESKDSDGGMPILKEIGKEKERSAHDRDVVVEEDEEDEEESKSNGALTFEKRKVIPQRRTQSQQSMLSSISLRSVMQDQQQMQRNSVGSVNNNEQLSNSHTNTNTNVPPMASHSLLNISQQIRSPAMFSIRRTGSLMQSSRKMSTGSSLRTKSLETDPLDTEEIGKKMPFTNDERVDVRRTRKEKQQRSPLQTNVEETQKNENDVVVGSHDSVLTEGKPDEDEEMSQKNLTTQALRKLSNFKTQNVNASFKETSLEENRNKVIKEEGQRKSDTELPEISQPLPSNENISSSYKTTESTPKVMRTNSDLNNATQTPRNTDQSSTETDRSGTSSNNMLNFSTASKSMTHIKFGDKNIMIDNTSDLPNSTSNQNLNVMAAKHNNSSNGGNKGIPRMHSSDTLHRPIRYPSQNSNSNLQYSNLNRRNIKQIKNPKKPLYVPVVLRDVAETNITNEDLEDVSPKMIRQKSPVNRVRNTDEDELGSQRSVRSNGSSVIESYRRYISSLIFSNKNDQSNDSGSAHQRNFTPSTMGSYSSSVISINQRSPQLPTRRHWVPDSKRSACHQCHKLFTFFERKHHCRHCGDIFCQKHLRHWLYLDSDAKFVIGGGGVGTLSKVCDNCHLEYEELAKTNLSPAINNLSKRGTKSVSRVSMKESANPMNLDSALIGDQSTSKPIVVKKNENDDTKNKNDQENLNSVVGSVPADWNWSSF